MNNQTIILKIKEELNKLDSQDYTNLENWMILDRFNSEQVIWVRGNLRGDNIKQEGDEQSTSRIDDFQMLMVSTPQLLMNNRQTFFETVNPLPTDYLRFKRISANAVSECCEKPKRLVVYVGEAENPDILLRDVSKNPSFEWGETFATFGADKFRIYTDEKFDVQDVYLTYYRQPRRILMTGVKDSYTGLTPTADVICELNEDAVEILVLKAAERLAGDYENAFQAERASRKAAENN